MNMKKIWVLVLCLLLVLSMTGCGVLRAAKTVQKDIDKGSSENVIVETPTPNSSEVPTSTDTPAPTETPTESSTDSAIIVMQSVVNNFLQANIANEGILDLVGIFNSDYELVEHIKYYNDALLCKAMVKDSVFTNISKANSLTVEGVDVLSRGVYNVAIKNDLGNEFNLTVIKVGENYLIDISNLFISSDIIITADVEAYLNGVKLSEDNFKELDSYGARIYTIPYLLAHIENTMTYETNYSEPLNRGFIVDTVTDEAVDMQYHFTAEDLTDILPKTAELWNALHTAANNKDTVGVSALLTDDSPLLVNTIVDGHKTQDKITAKSFEERPDSFCFLISKNRIALNLRSVFIGDYSYGTYTPSKLNWAIIDIQEDDSYKIYDASTEVWVNGNINAFSKD